MLACTSSIWLKSKIWSMSLISWSSQYSLVCSVAGFLISATSTVALLSLFLFFSFTSWVSVCSYAQTSFQGESVCIQEESVYVFVRVCVRF